MHKIDAAYLAMMQRTNGRFFQRPEEEKVPFKRGAMHVAIAYYIQTWKKRAADGYGGKLVPAKRVRWKLVITRSLCMKVEKILGTI